MRLKLSVASRGARMSSCVHDRSSGGVAGLHDQQLYGRAVACLGLRGGSLEPQCVPSARTNYV